jgi:hypothetical protein
VSSAFDRRLHGLLSSGLVYRFIEGLGDMKAVMHDVGVRHGLSRADDEGALVNDDLIPAATTILSS